MCLEYTAVAILVTAAALLVIRRLVKGVSGGCCSSCDKCSDTDAPSCDDSTPPGRDEAPGDD